MSKEHASRVDARRLSAAEMRTEPTLMGLCVDMPDGTWQLVTVPLSEHQCVELAGQLMDLAKVRRISIDKAGRLDFTRRGKR